MDMADKPEEDTMLVGQSRFSKICGVNAQDKTKIFCKISDHTSTPYSIVILQTSKVAQASRVIRSQIVREIEAIGAF